MSDRDWYSARILLEALFPDDTKAETLFEEQVILINAGSEPLAKSKAKRFGKSAEHEYLNGEGGRVQWRFRGVLDLVSLHDAPADGAEVYYGFLGEREVEAIRQSLKPGHQGADDGQP